MITFSIISPEELTDEDIFWLVKSAKYAFDGCAAVDYVNAALDGKVGLYRVEGDAQGMIVLEREGKIMNILGLGGKNFLREFKAIHEKILMTAAAAGATKVRGFAVRAGLAELYKRNTKAKLVPMFVEDVL